ncbi:MAG: hypothetical protein ACOYL8_04585 [Patescibacteria group bacterium]
MISPSLERNPILEKLVEFYKEIIELNKKYNNLNKPIKTPRPTEPIVTSIHTSKLVLETNISGGVPCPQIERKLLDIAIYYSIEDNRERISKEETPFKFGLSLILALNFDKRSFQVVIAKTREGCCEIIKPKFDETNFLINAKRCEIKFNSFNDFQDILNIVEEEIKKINTYLKASGLEELIENFEIHENK